MKAHTAETQATMTPEKAVEFLKEGNERFQKNLKANRNLLQQVNETSKGQFPFAAIVSCIDSRTSAELIFDQGLGDIFSIRIAGNFVNKDILGSLEFACEIAGSKLIVVLGHTHCGAVTAACKGGDAGGHMGQMLAKLQPAVEKARQFANESDLENFADQAAAQNVKLTMEKILADSPKLAEMEKAGKIGVVGGIYDVKTGVVNFLPAEVPAQTGA